MVVYGLTGGICSGKSTVAKMFSDLGVPIIDADIIAREQLEPGMPAYLEVVNRFGDRILGNDNNIDRRKLRSIVFENSVERKWLESQIHPSIRKRMREQAESLDFPYCIMVIPLLAESEPARELVDKIIVVDVPVAVQLKRLIDRDHIPETVALKMIAAQADREDRLAFADYVIDDNCSIAEVMKSVKNLQDKFQQA